MSVYKGDVCECVHVCVRVAFVVAVGWPFYLIVSC